MQINDVFIVTTDESSRRNHVKNVRIVEIGRWWDVTLLLSYRDDPFYCYTILQRNSQFDRNYVENCQITLANRFRQQKKHI